MTKAMATRLLLAIDKSVQSRRMADYLSEMVRPEAVEITLLNIFSSFPEVFSDFQPDHATVLGQGPSEEGSGAKGGQEALEQVGRILASAGFPEERLRFLARELRQGVARDIALEARAGHDLLALGTRGESSVAKLVFGGVTSKLLSSLTETALCLVEGKPEYPRALAALDGSAESLNALLFWAGLVRPSCEVTLFHVVREVGDHEPEPGHVPIMRQPSRVWVEDHLRSFNRVLETSRTEVV